MMIIQRSPRWGCYHMWSGLVRSRVNVATFEVGEFRSSATMQSGAPLTTSHIYRIQLSVPAVVLILSLGCHLWNRYFCFPVAASPTAIQGGSAPCGLLQVQASFWPKTSYQVAFLIPELRSTKYNCESYGIAMSVLSLRRIRFLRDYRACRVLSPGDWRVSFRCQARWWDVEIRRNV